MKIPNVPHREENGRTVLILRKRKAWEVAKGHQPYRSGAGIHADKRGKRARTRQAQIQRAFAVAYR